jgi:phage-related protein
MQPLRELIWVGSVKNDLKALPDIVQDALGYALYRVQRGGVPVNAKPLHGFGGAGVLEIADDFDGNTYRAVCTVRLATAIYVLHVFQKKSKRGVTMPRLDLNLVRERLRQAEAIDSQRRKDQP